MSAAYGCVSAAYGCVSAAYGCMSAAYGCMSAAYVCMSAAYGCVSAAYGCMSAAYVCMSVYEYSVKHHFTCIVLVEAPLSRCTTSRRIPFFMASPVGQCRYSSE
jgi:hypothetical protein